MSIEPATSSMNGKKFNTPPPVGLMRLISIILSTMAVMATIPSAAADLATTECFPNMSMTTPEPEEFSELANAVLDGLCENGSLDPNVGEIVMAATAIVDAAEDAIPIVQVPSVTEGLGPDTAVACVGVGPADPCNDLYGTQSRCWGMGSWSAWAEIVSGAGSYTISAECNGSSVAGCTAYTTPGWGPEKRRCESVGNSTGGGFRCIGKPQAQTDMTVNRGCGDPINPGKFCLAVEPGVPYDEDLYCNRVDTVAIYQAAVQ